MSTVTYRHDKTYNIKDYKIREKAINGAKGITFSLVKKHTSDNAKFHKLTVKEVDGQFSIREKVGDKEMPERSVDAKGLEKLFKDIKELAFVKEYLDLKKAGKLMARRSKSKSRKAKKSKSKSRKSKSKSKGKKRRSKSKKGGAKKRRSKSKKASKAKSKSRKSKSKSKGRKRRSKSKSMKGGKRRRSKSKKASKAKSKSRKSKSKSKGRKRRSKSKA